MSYAMVRRGPIRAAMGDVPRGFIEVADPPLWTFRGTPVVSLGSPKTLFLRAELYPFMRHVSRISPPPRYVIYGGPMTEDQYPSALRALREWAFFQRDMNGVPMQFEVNAEKALIAPDNFNTRWPRRTFAWTWEQEFVPPSRYRWEGTNVQGASGQSPGQWVRIDGGR